MSNEIRYVKPGEIDIFHRKCWQDTPTSLSRGGMPTSPPKK